MTMSIKDFTDKIKPIWTPLFFVVMSVLFFGLGRLSASVPDSSPVAIREKKTENVVVSNKQSVDTETIVGSADTSVIASKTGSKYYFPWCGALKRIKPENRVSFASVLLAQQAGYEPASNCKGVK